MDDPSSSPKIGIWRIEGLSAAETSAYALWVLGNLQLVEISDRDMEESASTNPSIKKTSILSDQPVSL